MLTFNQSYVWANGRINKHGSLDIVVFRVVGI